MGLIAKHLRKSLSRHCKQQEKKGDRIEPGKGWARNTRTDENSSTFPSMTIPGWLAAQLKKRHISDGDGQILVVKERSEA